MNRPVDLTNCDREPIHIPGSIQPFGFLLGLQSDFTICMASENVADYLGRDCAEIFQRPAEEVLSKAAVDAIRARSIIFPGRTPANGSSAYRCRRAASRSTSPSISPASI